MGKPRFFAENFFHPLAFPGHTVSANEEATGQEAFRVGNYRRSAADHWRPTTDNSSAWIKVQCDQQRPADMIAIDRGHNLEGETVTLETSEDDFVSSTTVFSLTVPSSLSADTPLSASAGAYTEEGAWVKSFTSTSATYWRLTVSAMGAGLVPRIVGLWIGASWQPGFHEARPWHPWGRELDYQEVRGPTVWSAASQVSERYSTEVSLRLENRAQYDVARETVEDWTFRGRPTWYVPDQAKAERSWLGTPPPGTHAFEHAQGWGYMQTTFPLVEHQPDQTRVVEG